MATNCVLKCFFLIDKSESRFRDDTKFLAKIYLIQTVICMAVNRKSGGHEIEFLSSLKMSIFYDITGRKICLAILSADVALLTKRFEFFAWTWVFYCP